jgi:hypothetical protein
MLVALQGVPTVVSVAVPVIPVAIPVTGILRLVVKHKVFVLALMVLIFTH